MRTLTLLFNPSVANALKEIGAVPNLKERDEAMKLMLGPVLDLVRDGFQKKTSPERIAQQNAALSEFLNSPEGKELAARNHDLFIRLSTLDEFLTEALRQINATPE